MNPTVNQPDQPPTAALPLERVPADIVETDAGWSLVLALPGVAETDVELRVERGSLKVAATRTDDVPEGVRVLRKGPGSARLEREFLLPDGVGPDAVRATLAAGLLRVEIARPHKASVNVPIKNG
jgi:HSP20 family protein